MLQLDDVQVGDPGQGQVHIRHTAIGVNFVDTYQRSASYVDTIRKGMNHVRASIRIPPHLARLEGVASIG